MTRSGYSDDYDTNTIHLYRRAVNAALDGKRGQAFLREMVEALDAMPVRELIAEDLARDGAVCAIGSVGVRRGIDMSALDPSDSRAIAKAFGIAPAMVKEIAWENDEGACYWAHDDTPTKRWQRMRTWAANLLREDDR